MTHKELAALLKKEMLPATGCTAPVGFGLAAAAAKPYVTAAVKEIRVYVSPSLFKLGFGVASPGTSQPGIAIATAIGFYGGDYKLAMQVLSTVEADHVAEAQKLHDKGIIHLFCEDGHDNIYVRDEIVTENETIETVVEFAYDNLTLVKVNEKVCFEGGFSGGEENNEERLEDHPEQLHLEEIFEFAKTASLEEVGFLLDGYKMNRDLAVDGITAGLGLKSGRALLKRCFLGKEEPADLMENPLSYLPTTPVERASILVAAASDARMGGSKYPALAAMGDGNQGITATIPVATAGELLGKTDLEIARALALSCLTLFYVKMWIGRASAVCMCAIGAASGIAAGVSLLRGYNEKQIRAAVKNSISPLAGMLCDGAKNGCALKMTTAVLTAFNASDIAGFDVEAGFYDGVADTSMEDTVLCVAKITNESTDMLDNSIVRAIADKTKR